MELGYMNIGGAGDQIRICSLQRKCLRDCIMNLFSPTFLSDSLSPTCLVKQLFECGFGLFHQTLISFPNGLLLLKIFLKRVPCL